MSSTRYVASNEQVRRVTIVRVPERCWALLPSALAQRDAARKRQCLVPGVRETRRPNTMFEHERRSGLLNEHDGLGWSEMVFILGQATLGVTPQPFRFADRIGQEYRTCSYDYLVRFFSARLAHVVVSTRTVHAVDLAKTATLRYCMPCEAQLRDAGVFDFSYYGLLAADIHTPPESTHRLLNVAVAGVSLCKFPVENRENEDEEGADKRARRHVEPFIGDELHLLIIADAWVRGWVGGGAAYDEGDALAQWLERAPSQSTYSEDERAAYEQARAAAFDAAPSDQVRVAAGQELRLGNFRLRAVAVQAGTMDYSEPKRQFHLRACENAAEVVVGSWCIGRVLERSSHTESGFCKVQLAMARFSQRDAVGDLLAQLESGSEGESESASAALLALRDADPSSEGAARAAERIVARIDAARTDATRLTMTRTLAGLVSPEQGNERLRRRAAAAHQLAKARLPLQRTWLEVAAGEPGGCVDALRVLKALYF